MRRRAVIEIPLQAEATCTTKIQTTAIGRIRGVPWRPRCRCGFRGCEPGPKCLLHSFLEERRSRCGIWADGPAFPRERARYRLFQYKLLRIDPPESRPTSTSIPASNACPSWSDL